MPLVSIIVPVYNVEKYLKRCVDSILAQTFIDYELILVDDGSSDSSDIICDEYAAKFDKIYVIHQKNGGLSAARNAGMSIARGEYFLFCDSDDYVSPQWCETLVSSAVKHPKSYVFGGIHKVSIDDIVADRKHISANSIEKEYPICAFLKLHTESKAGFAWNVLYDAAIIHKNNILFRQDLIVEDLPFCLEYLKHTHSLVYCGHAGYYYLQRDSSTLSRKYYQDGYRKWREKYALIQDFVDECIAYEAKESCRETIANYYLYFFLASLNNTFDDRSNLSIVQKLRYNQKAINSHEFVHCLQNSSVSNENSRYLHLLKTGNYYAAYLYALGSKLKNRIINKLKSKNLEEKL